MDNLATTSALCTAIASAFYPDRSAVAVSLQAAGVDPGGQAVARDAALFRVAARLVQGFVDTARTEGGVSVSADLAAVRRSLRSWAAEYGVDPDTVDGTARTIDNASNLW